VLQLDGELDLGSSPHLQVEIERALRGGADSVVVDVRRLRFIDMAGVRVLLVGREHAEREGRRLVLTGVREPIRRVLTLARVGDLLVAE
jgi:anti-anti-sigma factor